MVRQARGLNVHKRLSGRKRQLFINTQNTQGRLWPNAVLAAHEPDGLSSIDLITTLLWLAGE